MKVSAKMTPSQERVVASLHASNNVTHVREGENRRLVVVMCKDPDDLSCFRWSLAIGKRGRVFEDEWSDF